MVGPDRARARLQHAPIERHRAREIVTRVERDGEVRARERELWVERERAAEGFGTLLVLELFEQRDAEVIGAIRLLALIPRGGRLRRCLLSARPEDGGGSRDQDNGE